MRLVLARLVFNYDLVLADRVSERFLECKAFKPWIKGPLLWAAHTAGKTGDD
jgi:hypothetical protein